MLTQCIRSTCVTRHFVDSDCWVVGLEYGPSDFARLERALWELGYALTDESYTVGSTHRVSKWRACSRAGQLYVQSEAHTGLTLSGPTMLVAQVKDCFGRVDAF
jgi:hypothetical protein